MIKAIILLFLVTGLSHGKGYLNYGQSTDVFHIIDSISRDVDNVKHGVMFNYWSNKYKLSSNDLKEFNNFREVRNKYTSRNGEFDRFSLAFYRANKVDGAMKNLKKFLKKKDLKIIVKSMRYFRDKVSQIISESHDFLGKKTEINKLYKKKKVFKSYEKALRFFSLKSKFKAKIFFLWWPKKEEAKIEVVQNIIFVKIHPLNNIEKILTEKVILEKMILSLFKSLPKVKRDNFEKVVFANCSKTNFYKIMGSSLGYLPYLKNTQKKNFDSFNSYYQNKKENLLTILNYQLYMEQQKSKRKFYGDFANKLSFICSQIN